MHIAKIFSNGRSQAIRLPKDCRFSASETAVYAHKFEGMVILVSKRKPWEPLIHSLNKFSDDFMKERRQPRAGKDRKDFL